MGDGDYLTDKFPDADLDPRHNLSNDILDYNTNVTDKKFKYISDSYMGNHVCFQILSINITSVQKTAQK